MAADDIDDPDDGGSPPDPPPPYTPPPAIVTASLPNAALAVPYSQQLVAQNGAPPYTFAQTAGNLPDGIVLNESGIVAGTPTQTGTFTFIATVTDSAAATGSIALPLDVPAMPTIANAALPQGTVGDPYAAALAGQGGAAPYGFQIIGGGLPSGLALADTGGITGTPLLAGSFSVTIQIYDSNDPQGIGSSTFVIVIVPASIANPVTTMDACVLIACEDGGLYAIIPGQRFDTNYAGTPVGFLQRWQGVPAPSAKLTQLQLGGATVGAKGNGALNVTAIDGVGRVTSLSMAARPMNLQGQTEVIRDFMAKGVAKSERFGIALDNGGVAGAWFEAHTAILWVRNFFTGRKG